MDLIEEIRVVELIAAEEMKITVIIMSLYLQEDKSTQSERQTIMKTEILEKGKTNDIYYSIDLY